MCSCRTLNKLNRLHLQVQRTADLQISTAKGRHQNSSNQESLQPTPFSTIECRFFNFGRASAIKALRARSSAPLSMEIQADQVEKAKLPHERLAGIEV
jgi:hypothetical protein